MKNGKESMGNLHRIAEERREKKVQREQSGKRGPLTRRERKKGGKTVGEQSEEEKARRRLTLVQKGEASNFREERPNCKSITFEEVGGSGGTNEATYQRRGIQSVMLRRDGIPRFGRAKT